jgi:hypothetical protein
MTVTSTGSNAYAFIKSSSGGSPDGATGESTGAPPTFVLPQTPLIRR